MQDRIFYSLYYTRHDIDSVARSETMRFIDNLIVSLEAVLQRRTIGSVHWRGKEMNVKTRSN